MQQQVGPHNQHSEAVQCFHPSKNRNCMKLPSKLWGMTFHYILFITFLCTLFWNSSNSSTLLAPRTFVLFGCPKWVAPLTRSWSGLPKFANTWPLGLLGHVDRKFEGCFSCFCDSIPKIPICTPNNQANVDVDIEYYIVEFRISR